MNDLTQALQERVAQSFNDKSSLTIRAGGSKAFYTGTGCAGETLNISEHRGLIDYEPTELVITARSGTPLEQIEQTLAAQNQMLSFEPPHFGGGATVGGMVACGFSGPRRPYGGSVRDAVLGCSILNGRGQHLRFGGQVMKNVAGYDLSRLITGAFGTLGVVLDVSLKVLPRPHLEKTLSFELTPVKAIKEMSAWGSSPLPLSAMTYVDGRVFLRVSGSDTAVSKALVELGGDVFSDAEGEAFWLAIRNQTHSFFTQYHGDLWRYSLAPSESLLSGHEQALMDWGGAVRWVYSNEAPEHMFRMAAERGGHATLWRSRDEGMVRQQPLSAGHRALQAQIKHAFDPHNILNPGCPVLEF